MVQYVEMTIEEAMKRCDKNAKVLVAIQNLEDDDCNIVFVKKRRNEYQEIFDDVKTVASICDDFVKQLRLFTEKQNIPNIEPHGYQKTILLKEWIRTKIPNKYSKKMLTKKNKCSIITAVNEYKKFAYHFIGVGAPLW